MKVVFGTDGSACSIEAAKRLPTLLPTENVELHVLSVAPLVIPAEFPSVVGTPYVDYPLLTEEIRAEAQRHAEEAQAVFKEKGLEASVHVTQGDAATELMNLAKAEHADLIAVGSHGRKGFQRFLLGSVSQRVLTEASCAVLVIKTIPAGSQAK